MGLVTGKLPNLVNGVSQQPPALRASTQCAVAENAMMSLVEGMKKRSSARYIAKLIASLAQATKIHFINRDATERYIVVMLDGDLKVFDLQGNEKTVTFPDGKGYLDVSNPKTDFKLVTVADYTFIVNTTKTVAMNSATTTNRGGEVLIWARDGGEDAEVNLYVDGTKVIDKKYTVTSPGGLLDALYTDLVAALGSTHDITRDSGDYSNQLIHMKRKDGADFTFHATDNDNAWIKYCKYNIQNFEDLPAFALNDYIAHIIGAPSTKFDDYYVQFVADAGTTGNKMSKGYWKECVGQGIQYAFDATTMPHTLVRNSNGTFTFAKATWDNRVVGDDSTNAKPSFVGNGINDVFFYRNRLSFLSDENVIMSEAGDYFNFWRTTVTTLVDSDPIDVAASHNKVAILRHAVPFQDSLMFFSDQTQFYLDHGDVLSGVTAAIKPLTEFESIPSVRPTATGNNVYFASAKGDYCGIWEYYLDAESGVKDAVDVTKHIPAYIPATVTKIAATTNESLLAVLTNGETDALYTYRFYWQGNEKLQSAWSKWTFTGAEILDAEFIDSTLYMVALYGTELLLLSMPCEEEYIDPNASIEYLLDRKISDTKFTSAVYADGVTTVTLPFKISTGVTWQLITRPAGAGETQPYAEGVSIPFTKTGDNTFTILGDYSEVPMYFGSLYTMTYQFSPLYLREQTKTGGEVAITNGRLQLRKWDVVYGLSGYFKATVTPKLRNSFNYVFTGDTLGDGSITLGTKTLNSGIFSFPIYCRNTDVTVVITNDTYWPCRLLAVEWEGFYSARAERSNL